MKLPRVEKRTICQNTRKLLLYFHNAQYRFGKVERGDGPKPKNFPGPGETNVIIEPHDDGFYHNGRKTTLPKNLAGTAPKRDLREKDGLGPGSYYPKEAKHAPVFSFGTRFNSSVRNKDHLRP